MVASYFFLVIVVICSIIAFPLAVNARFFIGFVMVLSIWVWLVRYQASNSRQAYSEAIILSAKPDSKPHFAIHFCTIHSTINRLSTTMAEPNSNDSTTNYTLTARHSFIKPCFAVGIATELCSNLFTVLITFIKCFSAAKPSLLRQNLAGIKKEVTLNIRIGIKHLNEAIVSCLFILKYKINEF